MLKQCYFKLNYIRKQLICSKMAYSGYFSLGGNLDFLNFLQKKFYNINYWNMVCSIELFLRFNIAYNY